MRKSLLFISVSIFLLLTGCTKETTNASYTNSDDPIFFGSFGDDNTRVTLDDYTPEATTASLFWTNADEIGVFAEYAGVGEYKNKNIPYVAATTGKSSTTLFGLSPNTGQPIKIPDGMTDITYYAYHPYKSIVNQKYNTFESPLKAEYTYDNYTNDSSDKVFMIASAKAASANTKNIELQFTNAYALIYVGIKGTAKIDKLTVENTTSPITYSGGTIDLSKAPAAGTNDVAFIESKFFTPAEGDNGSNTVSMKFSPALQLKSEVTWIPLMTMPFTYDATKGLNISITATDKDGQIKTITKTGIGAKASDDKMAELNTNSVLYITLKEVNASELNQNPPKTVWNPGEIVFQDNFSWIAGLWKDDLDKNGWISAYNYNLYPRKNNISATTDATAFEEFLKHGYLSKPGNETNEKQILLLHSNEGFIQVGDTRNGMLTIPITNMYNTTKDITIKFRAARYVTKYGLPFTTSGNAERIDLPVIIKGAGKIKGYTEALPAWNTEDPRITVHPAEPFTWYDYTVVVEGANADTKIIFGDTWPAETAKPNFSRFFLDNIKIAIANGETTDAVGVQVAAETPRMLSSEPELSTSATTDVVLPALKGTTTLKYAVSGPWKLEFNSAAIPSWLDISGVHWATSSDDPERLNKRYKDEKGNQMTNQYTFTALTDNDTGVERSFGPLTIKSGEIVLGTFTLKQQAADAKTQVFKASFGTQSAEALTVTNTMGATEWGLGSYEPSWLKIAYNDENNNPGMALSNGALQGTDTNKTYANATAEGNLHFVVPHKEETPSSVFTVEIPIERLTGKEDLYVNFGLWADPSKETNKLGYFYMNIDFGTAGNSLSTKYTPTIDTPGWRWKENLIVIPTDATKCVISLYSESIFNRYTGDLVADAANNYRIDDIDISVR